MKLPEPLLPWREWLDWFSPELAPEVGELVCRLHPLLGRFHGHRQGGEPEPDGLGDLRRRGSYERLLSSEWLLAQEMPDEFLRRAATGEHLFLAPQPRARQADRLIVALFDAGPLQLGAPRLVHLALWILLARRARQAGGELRWGILQAQPALHEANHAEELRRLLKARTYDPATAEHHQAWQDWLAAQALRAGECWLVGRPLAAAVDIEGCSHRADATSSPDGQTLEVTVREGAARRRLVLPLPAAQAAVRLLKGQFQRGEPAEVPVQRSSSQRLSIALPPVISPQRQLIAVQMLDAPGVMIFQLPQLFSRRTAKPRRQQWPGGHHPLCATFAGKRFGALLSSGGRLNFRGFEGLVAQQQPPRELFEAPPGRARFLSAAWLGGGGNDRLFVVDTAGHLVYWGRTGGMHKVDDAVFGLAQVDDDCFVYVRREEGQMVAHRAGWAGKVSAHYRLGPVPDDPVVLFGGGRLWAKQFGACAVRFSAEPTETWRIYTPADDGSGFDKAGVTLPAGWRAIGLVQTPEDGRFALIVLGPQRNALALCSGRTPEALYMTAAPIAKYSVCPVSGLIALLTEKRELVVYSVRGRAVVLAVDGGRAGHAAE